MVSKNVEVVLKTLKSNPNLMKDLNNTLQKILDTAKVHLSDEETSELFRTMTEAIIIVDPRKDLVIIETKPAPQENDYQKDMDRERKKGTLDFEMWLRHVKNLTGQTIFQINVNADPAMDRQLREEYAKWKEQKRNE
ncbi:MAG: hypothetical protein ABSB89_04925 [Candidatus Bathyarchaeia archaeon]|jgi:hypothetical protein